jgi:FtsP/CotA-like multicopper oxidase with cupredoxin domain
MENIMKRIPFTRRQFIKLNALGAATALLPTGLMRSAYATVPFESDIVTCTGPMLVPPAPYQLPMTIPPVAQPFKSVHGVDHYLVETTEAQTEMVLGRQTRYWGYGGVTPGVTFKTKVRKPVSITHQNNLIVPTSVHLHGIDTKEGSDGHPQDLIDAFSSKRYIYPNFQADATLWYHDHRLGHTAEQAYAGLSGLYIIQDEQLDAQLNLPDGDYDVPLVISDKSFNDVDSVTASQCHETLGPGRARPGNMLLVNGRHAPYMKVEPRQYRFRLLNTANIRIFQLFLQAVGGETAVPNMTVIGSDHGYLGAPAQPKIINGSERIFIGQSERVEIIVDFADFAGKTVNLLNTGVRNIDAVIPEDSLNLLQFRVENNPPVVSAPLPSVLRPFTRLEDTVDVNKIPTRHVELNNIDGMWLLNGQRFGAAPDGASFTEATPHVGFDDIKVRSVEKWSFTSLFRTHPMHVHACRFQVISRSKNGQVIDPKDWNNPWERDSWKDTVVVSEGETVEVLIEFGHFPGLFVFHCHNLEHEDFDMMANFRIVADRKTKKR